MTTEHATAGEPVALSSEHAKLPREAAPHRQKFRVALAMLSGIALVAIVIAIVVVANSNSASAPKAGHWSAWAPTDSGTKGALEIAGHIGPSYKLTSSKQLNAVTPLPVTQMSSSGTTTGSGPLIVVNTGGKVITSSSLELLNGNTVAYNICGLAATRKCELPGTPSTDRMLLMRREALELALYTFKYVGDSQNVLVVLPPAHSTTKSSTGKSSPPVTDSVLFSRKELQPMLNLPLSESLQTDPPTVPDLPSWSQTDEATLVGEFTQHGIFTSQVEAQQTGGRLLVLSPVTS
jgi:hypothetical protein